jgi:hypothetical protein
LKLLVWVKIGSVKSSLNGEISPNLVTLATTYKLRAPIPQELFVKNRIVMLQKE